jgi:hypothetical protein
MQLFQQRLASRLILSVGRFEVRQTAQALSLPGLLDLRDTTPPKQRHFWVDYTALAPRIARASVKRASTFWELQAIAQYLGPDMPEKIAIVSTSIHLRRVRFCCRSIPAFKSTQLSFLPVPENLSSFIRDRWWTRPGHWSYVLSEFGKLVLYAFMYSRTR